MQSYVLRSARGLGTATGLIAFMILAGHAIAQENSNKVDAVTATKGAQVYKQARCYACHGEQGFGGVGPSFRQDRFLALPEYVIGQILVGRGIMPSFAEALDDEQIAAVATYIRTSWGNDFGEVKAQQAGMVRKTFETLMEKMPPRPQVSAAQPVQPSSVPVPPSGGTPPGQPLPPSSKQ